MAKMLSQKDFDFSAIGTKFELDEVTPVFETEQRTDKNGVVMTDKEGKPRTFNTDKLIGYNYSVTMLDGVFRKKSTQVKVLDTDLRITNEEIMKLDSVKCTFKDLKHSMIGNPMYYKAEAITLLEPIKK